MAVDPDEEALSWAASATQRIWSRRRRSRPSSTPSRRSSHTSSALLIVYGVFAGAFVLFTVGWIIFVAHLAVPVVDVLPTIMYRLGEGLSIGSPVIWFLGVLVLTRGGRTGARIGWLLLGILIVAPWPFILGRVS